MRRLLLMLLVVAAVAIASCAVPVKDDVSNAEEAVVEAAPTEAPEVPKVPEFQESPPEPEAIAEPVVKAPDKAETEFVYPYLGTEGAFAIIEYGDFSNQANTLVNNFQVAAMKRDFVVSNKAKIVFKPYPISGSEEAQLAAEASLCMWEQGSKQFWAYHDTLFTYFARLEEKSLNNYVGRVPNADKTAFAECLSSRKYEDTVKVTLEEGKSLGINHTPTFIIGSETIAGSVSIPYKTFKEAVEAGISKDNVITGFVALGIVTAASSFVRKALNWLG